MVKELKKKTREQEEQNSAIRRDYENLAKEKDEIQAENEYAREKVKEVLQAMQEPNANHDSIKRSQEKRRKKRTEQLKALLADLGEVDETQEPGTLVEKLKIKMLEQEERIANTKRDNKDLTTKMAQIQAENEDTKEEVKEVLRDLEELADNYAKIQAGNKHAKEKRKEVLQNLQELDNSYDKRAQEAETRNREYNKVRDELSQQQSKLSMAQAELSSVKESQGTQRKKMTEMLRTLLADLREVGQAIAKNQDPKGPEQGEDKIGGEFNRIVEKYQAKMGAMTDPDHADEETKAKHQANNKDTTGRDAKSQDKKPAKDHEQQEDATGGQRNDKERNLIRGLITNKLDLKGRYDNIQGNTTPAIRRLARRGGVERTSGLNHEEAKKTDLNRDKTYKEARNTTTNKRGEKGPQKGEYEKPNDARGPDGYGGAPHHPREDRRRHVHGTAIGRCEEEDAAGEGPHGEGGGQ